MNKWCRLIRVMHSKGILWGIVTLHTVILWSSPALSQNTPSSRQKLDLEEQLQTIEEMVEYIKDQPFTLQNTQQEDLMIDNLLFETEQTQQSLEEIESLMASEFYPGLADDPGFDSELDSYEGKITE